MEAIEIIPEEKAELDRLERIVRTGIVSFYNVADALIQIRDKQYYKKVLGFPTFEEYCNTRWEMTRQHAYQLIDAKQVADNLSTTVDKKELEEIPERQLRPLAALPPEEQATVYRLAKETAEGKLTARHVESVVREVRGEAAKEKVRPIPQSDLISDDFRFAFDRMTIELKNARALKWKTTSHKAAIELMGILLDISQQ